MSRKGFTPEQIITMLREAEVLLSQGAQVSDVWRKLGISEQSYYRWRKEHGQSILRRWGRPEESRARAELDAEAMSRLTRRDENEA